MDAFSNIMFHAHSGLRYLVLLAGVLALAYSVTLAVRGQPWDRRGRVFLTIFVGVLDLQVLTGLILVFVRAFYPMLWGHIVMMVLAAAAAHVASAMNKRRPPERRSHRLAVAGVGLAFVFIIGGIMAIGRPIL